MGTHQPIRKTVLPEIPDKLYFRIGDVARLCEVPAYVLRFWETEFPQLKPNKGGTGQRLYRKRDVEMALRIKSLLYDQGYTIPGARQVFKSEARVKGVPSVSPIPSTLASEEFSASPRPIAERSSELRPVAPEGEAEATRQAKLRLLREQMQNLLDSLSAPLDSSSSVRPGRANLPSERPSASRLQALRPRLVSGSPESGPALQLTLSRSNLRSSLTSRTSQSEDQPDLFPPPSAPFE